MAVMLKRAALAPVLALGPLTGPLVLGVVAYARAGRFLMAAVCLLGLVEVWCGLPALLAAELQALAHLG